MSQILKALLQPQIQSVLESFGSNEYSGPETGATAQQQFAENLAAAIATAVQQYIANNVITIPAPGPVNHFHKMRAP